MTKRIPVLVAMLLIGMLIALGGGTVGAAETYKATTIAAGLNTPTGVLVHPDGSIWVAESGVPGSQQVKSRNFENGQNNSTAIIGFSATVLRIAPNGKRTVEAKLPTVKIGQALYGTHHLVLLKGAVYVATTAWADYIQMPRPRFAGSVVKIDQGKVSELANLFAYENAYNPDGFQKESDPYGIAAGPDGNLWVTEAGANDVFKIDPATGKLTLVAVFPGMFSPIPNPNRNGQMTTDPVPTGIDVGRDGNIYVGFLTGSPFLPGTSKIVKITPEGKVSNYATGLTMLTDVRFGPDGNLYALSFGEFTQKGLTDGSGKVYRIKPGNASEVVVSGINTPTAFDFDKAGNAYMTIKGWGGPGVGELVKYDHLTSRPAESTVAKSTNDANKQTAWIVEKAPAAITQTVAATKTPQLTAPWLLALVATCVVCTLGGLLFKRSRRLSSSGDV